jgi:hypothetical protein
MKSYFVIEEDFDTLRKASGSGEGEEDLYLRSDVAELGDAREARVRGAVSGSIFDQIEAQSGNSLLVGVNPALL